MFYRIKDNIALRKWKYVDHAIYKKGVDHAFSITSDEFNYLLKCDSLHDLDDNLVIKKLLDYNYIEECDYGNKINEWSSLKGYDNFYFPKMNLMITGKCNLNCLHCFNAKDNAPLNSELSYENIIRILDDARDIGVHTLTITGGRTFSSP